MHKLFRLKYDPASEPEPSRVAQTLHKVSHGEGVSTHESGHCDESEAPLTCLLRVVHLGRSTCHAISGQSSSDVLSPSAADPPQSIARRGGQHPTKMVIVMKVQHHLCG